MASRSAVTSLQPDRLHCVQQSPNGPWDDHDHTSGCRPCPLLSRKTLRLLQPPPPLPLVRQQPWAAQTLPLLHRPGLQQ